MFAASAGRKYSKTESGLRILNVSRSDRGVYICRARVANTGQMEERDIRLEVSREREIERDIYRVIERERGKLRGRER